MGVYAIVLSWYMTDSGRLFMAPKGRSEKTSSKIYAGAKFYKVNFSRLAISETIEFRQHIVCSS